jgi:iron complex outermembrane receptor protein
VANWVVRLAIPFLRGRTTLTLHNTKYRLLAGAALSGIIMSIVPTPAIAEQSSVEQAEKIEIPASSLDVALKAYSAQTGTALLFSQAVIADKSSPGLSGTYPPREALSLLLAGTDLEAVRGEGNAYLVREKQTDPDQSSPVSVQSEKPDVIPDALPEPDKKASSDDLIADKVVVTGTSLRGFAPESSPLFVYGREEILESGAASTEEFIRQLPQNFGGGSTEFAPYGIPGDDSSKFNNTFGSGANLRGLGSGATLTLVNGRRLAPTSSIGDFVDLSMIPISALERVDVLGDGASSIYGGDAVAGVMNFVLRDDYDGAETALQYGSVTSGDMKQYRASQTLGKSWSGGNILAAYEYYHRDNLTLADRPQIPRQTLSNGDEITVNNLFDLLPEQDRHSLILSGKQSLTSRLELSGSGLYSKRSSRAYSFLGRSTVSVAMSDAESELIALSGGGDYEFASGWAASLDLTYSRVRNNDYGKTLVPVQINPARSNTDSNLASADLVLTGDLFALPGGKVKAAIGGHLRQEDFENSNSDTGLDRKADRDVRALYAEVQVPFVGQDNGRPGIERLELNLSGRLDDYSDFGTTSNPKIGLLWSPADGLNLRGTYSTSFSPPALGRTGDLGRLGIVYPMSYILSALGNLTPPDPALADMDYLRAVGTAGNLDPETSRTYTFGADYQGGGGGRAWSASVNYYDIAFEGRLGSTPMPLNQSPLLAPFIEGENPGILPPGTVIFFPTPEEVAALAATFNQPVLFWPGLDSLDNIGVINNAAVVRNLASTETSGLDLQLGYETETRFGQISGGISANYILDFTQQATDVTAPVETLNTLRNPVDLQLQSRLGLTRGGFSGTVRVNYLDDYRTDGTDMADKIGSWTTVDLSLAYDFGQETAGLLKGTRLSLSVRNALDEAPPAVPVNGSLRTTGYDQANASPLMRFVSLEFRKAF